MTNKSQGVSDTPTLSDSVNKSTTKQAADSMSFTDTTGTILIDVVSMDSVTMDSMKI